jgi:hypothetical protein
VPSSASWLVARVLGTKDSEVFSISFARSVYSFRNSLKSSGFGFIPVSILSSGSFAIFATSSFIAAFVSAVSFGLTRQTLQPLLHYPPPQELLVSVQSRHSEAL